MTRLLLLLALAAVVLLALRRRDERIPARWLEDDDAIAPPDPWTVGLLGETPTPTGVWTSSAPVTEPEARFARSVLEPATRYGLTVLSIGGIRWKLTKP